MENNHSVVRSAVKTGAILLAIAVVIALILSFVNYMTAPVIAANDEATRQQAIAEIFEGCESAKVEYKDDAVSELFEIRKDGAVVGYCCHVSADGFADKIEMMIGIDCGTAGNTVRAIRILSIQDTPGIGLKVNDPEYLGKYSGAASGNEVDAITGATYSSKGIRAGADASLSAVNAFTAKGGENA